MTIINLTCNVYYLYTYFIRNKPPPLREMEWSEDLVLQLIEAYRERPVLWDVGHKLFKIKTKRNDVWEELATIFNTDRYEEKKKINSLLASFRRERRKVVYSIWNWSR